MGKPKDCKVWNEDLVLALRAREEMARQEGKQRQYLWRDGAQIIASVRSDIYAFQNGRIVGLPTRQLKKTVDDLCRKILQGDEPVLPAGYAPSNRDESQHFRGGNNAMENHPYLSRIKIRGGAFAILMAFQTCSDQRQTMTKEQIIQAAQPFCDEAMEGNFHAGRPIGAWKGHETLVKHGFLHVQQNAGRAAYVNDATTLGPPGFRVGGKNMYTLTREGELFLQALLQRNPDIRNQVSNSQNEPRLFHDRATTPEPFLPLDSPVPVVTGSPHPPQVRFSVSRDSLYSEKEKSAFASLPNKRPRTTAAGNAATATAAGNPALQREALFESSSLSSMTMNRAFAENTVLPNIGNSDPPIHWEEAISKSNDIVVIDLLYDDNMKKMPSRACAIRPSSKRKLNLDAPDVLEIIDGDDENHDEDEQLLSWSRPFNQGTINSNLPGVVDLPVLQKGISFSIWIDARERNRNCTPRFLRTELSRLLWSGPVDSGWPASIPKPEIEEVRLTQGDFNFVAVLNNEMEDERTGTKRTTTLPVMVERKRIGDLVQRSAAKDHWRQLQQMRDRPALSILLLEGDFRTAGVFEAFGIDEKKCQKKTDHTIDDEHSLLRFMGRAILSSDMIRFVQTKDEQDSLRAIIALGLVSIASVSLTSSFLNHDSNPYKTSGSNGGGLLLDRLVEGGIPYPLAKDLSEEIGSRKHLENIYSEVIDDDCREQLLSPYLEDACERIEGSPESSAAHSWSRAIHSVFFTTFSDPNDARLQYQKFENFVTDRPELLYRIHRGESPEKAAAVSFAASNEDTNLLRRRVVEIEIPEHLKCLFDEDDAFYSTKISPPANKNLVVMQTRDEIFESHALYILLLEGSEMTNMLSSAMKERTTCYGASLLVAALLDQKFRTKISLSRGVVGPNFQKDRRVLLIRGLRPALEQLAKQSDYPQESRFLADLVLAHLIVSYDVVVLQAVRKGDLHCKKTKDEIIANDRSKILRALALACFQFQLLTQKR